MSFRKERKFKMNSSDSLILRSKLLKKGMNTLHPDRMITSQYFDTKDFESFRQSEEGILPRKKIRVRWYNNNMQKLTFEEKTSSIEGRFKTSSKIKKIDYDKLLADGFFHKIYGKINPSVKINYSRSYFEFKKIRITFDSSIIYSFIDGYSIYRDFDEVVEMKTPIHCSDDYLEKLIDTPVSRFSKYCRAFLIRDNLI
ncbi:VTC domain-containing protein [Candidatus Pelagibacter sp.]|jgi:SPX domain protein involved in polyphosphate accumulation|nr:VTC domain-containing protein [Candidatus Pelagibacter sp.]